MRSLLWSILGFLAANLVVAWYRLRAALRIEAKVDEELKIIKKMKGEKHG